MPTDAKLTRMIEILIGQSDLTEYFHVEQRPERVPVHVAVADPADFSAGAKAFGEPVEFIAEAKTDETSLSVTVGTAKEGGTQIDFRYPPEGVVGKAVFSDAAEPVLTSMSISEQ